MKSNQKTFYLKYNNIIVLLLIFNDITIMIMDPWFKNDKMWTFCEIRTTNEKRGYLKRKGGVCFLGKIHKQSRIFLHASLIIIIIIIDDIFGDLEFAYCANDVTPALQAKQLPITNSWWSSCKNHHHHHHCDDDFCTRPYLRRVCWWTDEIASGLA